MVNPLNIELLKQKVGPFPAYVYVVAAVFGGALFIYLRNKNGATVNAVAPVNPSTPLDTIGGADGGSGGGGITYLPTPTTPSQPPDTTTIPTIPTLGGGVQQYIHFPVQCFDGSTVSEPSLCAPPAPINQPPTVQPVGPSQAPPVASPVGPSTPFIPTSAFGQLNQYGQPIGPAPTLPSYGGQPNLVQYIGGPLNGQFLPSQQGTMPFNQIPFQQVA